MLAYKGDRRRERLGGATAVGGPVHADGLLHLRLGAPLSPGMQLDAALITAASAMVIGFGRSATTDMPLTATFTVAMLSLVWLV